MMRFLIAAVLATRLLADTNAGQLSGPVLGHTKRNGVLLPLVGVPGAAYFGSPIDLAGLELAAFSSRGGYAVALTADRRSVRIVRLPGGVATDLSMGIVNAPVNSVRLSPTGSAAALISDEAVDIVVGLPELPVSKGRIAKSSKLRLVAVADDGDVLALVEESGAAWLIEGSDKRQIPATDVRDIEFRAASHDYVYVDGDVVGFASRGGSSVISGPAEGMSPPEMARLSPTSTFVAVGSRDSRELLIHVNSSGMRERVALPCSAAELEWLQDATLRISCQRTDAVHLLRIADGGVRVLFVPEPVE